MNAKYFANRNEGKNETKQKKGNENEVNQLKKHKQTTYRLFTSSSTFPSIILAGSIAIKEPGGRRKVMATMISNLKLVNSYVVRNSLIN